MDDLRHEVINGDNVSARDKRADVRFTAQQHIYLFDHNILHEWFELIESSEIITKQLDELMLIGVAKPLALHLSYIQIDGDEGSIIWLSDSGDENAVPTKLPKPLGDGRYRDPRESRNFFGGIGCFPRLY